ncbi:MAG: hypothetical protein IJU35_08280 [Paludibacteraceae bacterium]|nr:hypothetical protein [Paludibacteraceae bacterium]
MATYNIIGDIHGRTCWKELVQDDFVNIFVGDYLDPYEDIPYELLMENLRDIIAYKKEHPATVLLYGNHDMHYFVEKERSSRYDSLHAELIKLFFDDSKHLFDGVAYAIGDEMLVTHAGVTREWYENKFGEYKGEKPSQVAQNINQLWAENKFEFTFKANVTQTLDFYGESPTHSPMWIRPWVLALYNLFENTAFKQVFGHTQVEDLTTINDNLIDVDCLGTITKSFQTTL